MLRISFEQIVISFCSVLVVVIAFLLGIYSYQQVSNEENDTLRQSQTQELLRLQVELQQQEAELAQLQLENADYAVQEQKLMKSINELRGRVAGISTTEPVRKFPFAVPTSGVTGSQNGTFGGQMYTMKHLGIDIWTSQARGGAIASHKGNPVFSACNGRVVGIDAANAGVTISCDEISSEYNVPKRKVYTHYAHLGHAETKELYIIVKRNDRVSMGQQIGFQGDLSSYFPEMRNVHLHFSVFTGNSEVDPNGGALDPCIYIGGDCNKQGQSFIAPR